MIDEYITVRVVLRLTVIYDVKIKKYKMLLIRHLVHS